MKVAISVKVYGFLLFGLLLSAITPVVAQTSVTELPVPRTMLKTAPIHLEEINVAVEKFHRANRSWQYGAGYIYRTFTNSGSAGEPRGQEVNGLSVRLSYRMYPEKRFVSPQGGYHGPLATYRYMALPTEFYQTQTNQSFTLKPKQQVFSLQYLLGMQRVFKGWFVVDAYAGLGGRLKYATEKGSEDFYKHYNSRYYGGQFYGKRLAIGPDWAILLAPSFSFNIAFGVAL